ncbi:uncharacterized protein LOC143024783 [Oratosquilla oratoria]|uniref:uncharacterized protein LOC143024783 n=1 Tax=Oratosquilla oratoria TaxID=337810 RepID=UPI003F75B868
MEQLRSEWDAATSFAEGSVSERWWGTVSSQYTGEGRVFHNYSYLQQLFVLYHQYEDKLSNSQAVALAIFFHKLDYNPRSGEDGVKNLERFRNFMQEAGDGHQESPLAKSVETLLEASSTNLTEAHMTEGGSGSDDIHYFIDFTMSILGASQQEYDQYTTKIQAEYTHLATAAYNQLRAKILKSLLLIPNVFATREFQNEYESTARDNIQKEINRLNG